MVKSRKEKITDNVKYIWLQTERFVKAYYNKDVQLEVWEQKRLLRDFHVYSKIEMKEGTLNLYVDELTLAEGKKDDLFDIAGRAGVWIGILLNTGKPVKETDPTFINELKAYGLPYYDVYPQDGALLHTYRCLKCRKIMALTTKKIPDSKKFAYNPNLRTECCKAMIEYRDIQHYTNGQLQKFKSLINKQNTDE